VQIAKLFVKKGVSKIRLTGGEPTVYKQLLPLVQELSSMRDLGLKTIAMTTNGLILSRLLPSLQKAGLNQVNISFDTFDANKFTLLTRRLGWEQVYKSINLAIELGYNPVKINCVVQRGVNDDELAAFVAWTKDAPIEVRFIEYMPFEGNTWSNKLFISYKEMIKNIKQAGYDLVEAQGHPHDTSKTYQVPGHMGSVGFITSMSDHFCGTCNRLRLMADGALKVCLFGQNEVSLRDIIRNGGDERQLEDVISAAVKRKKILT